MMRETNPAFQLSFIDHYNLRRLPPLPDSQAQERALAAHVARVKRNLDRAKQYGIGTYILFSRSFERLVNYDFEVPGLGDLTGRVHPLSGEHRQTQAMWAACLREVLDHAQRLGIAVIFHTNQFDFPRSFYELAGDRVSGSALVCPGKQPAYDALEGKISEFFRLFPTCAGIQLTVSETQVSPKACNCESCRDIPLSQRFARVAEAVVRACRPLGKTMLMRTWGGFETVESVELLPEEVICSTKHTLPDFHLATPANPVLGLNAERQEVEFDAWGEYSGYNFFPCYMGDQLAERIRLCAQRDVKRLAIRLNWDPPIHPPINDIFERPYGNEVNIHLFSRLGADPNANPDDLLREYIAKIYPPSAHEAAFNLHKRSFDLQVTWLTWQGHNANDHSRVFRHRSGGQTYVQRVESQIGFAIPRDYGEVCRLIAERRQAIDDAYAEAQTLISKLGPEVPEDWRSELERGAHNAWFVAQGNCDCLLLCAAARETQAGRPLPDLSALERSIHERAQEWERYDPEMLPHLRGDSPALMLQELLAISLTAR